MEFIGAYWWLWLTMLVCSGAYALYHQLGRLKAMQKVAFSADFNQMFDSLRSGVVSLVVSALLAIGSGILLLLAIIINLIAHFSH